MTFLKLPDVANNMNCRLQLHLVFLINNVPQPAKDKPQIQSLNIGGFLLPLKGFVSLKS